MQPIDVEVLTRKQPISEQVFHLYTEDPNKPKVDDGFQNESEPNRSNQRVCLSHFGTFMCTKTDENGNTSFAIVPGHSYQLRIPIVPGVTRCSTRFSGLYPTTQFNETECGFTGIADPNQDNWIGVVEMGKTPDGTSIYLPLIVR